MSGDVVVYLLLGAVIAITFTLEGITGFGGTILALPFAFLLIGVSQAIPVLLVLSLSLAAAILVIDRRKIAWKTYLRLLLPVSIGIPIGITILHNLNEDTIKTILGVFIIAVSARGLYLYLSKAKSRDLPFIATVIVLIAGGIIHGAFASGGPLITIAAREKIADKSIFRATLCMLWLTLNGSILIYYVLAGRFTGQMLNISLICIPFLAAGGLLGNWAHRRIKEGHFSKIVYTALLMSGLLLLR